MSRFKIGDKVWFSESFLKSAGIHDYDLTKDKGEIIAVKPMPFGKNQYCKVQWLSGNTTGALSCNLAKTTY